MSIATDLQKAWFAGFYEGEGTIANDKSNGNRLRLEVYQNDVTPLLKGQELWGGKIYTRTRKSPASDKMCTGHAWRLNHHQALRFIEDIRSFMIIPYKINQVTNAFERAKHLPNVKYVCHFCDKEYTNPASRRRHEKKEHIQKGVLFSCESCLRTYKSRGSLQRHKRLNHNPDASGSIRPARHLVAGNP